MKKKSKDLKFKKKRGLSPCSAFLADKRAEIKALLRLRPMRVPRLAQPMSPRPLVHSGRLSKEVIDAAEKRIADGNDLTDEERDTYKNQNDEMAKYVAASEASKKEAAEYNEAKAKEITASHELQLENAKAASPKDGTPKAAAPKVSLKLSAKSAIAKASPTKNTSEVVVEKKPELEEGEVSEQELEEETKEQPKEETKEQLKEETNEKSDARCLRS